MLWSLNVMLFRSFMNEWIFHCLKLIIQSGIENPCQSNTTWIALPEMKLSIFSKTEICNLKNKFSSCPVLQTGYCRRGSKMHLLHCICMKLPRKVCLLTQVFRIIIPWWRSLKIVITMLNVKKNQNFNRHIPKTYQYKQKQKSSVSVWL